MAKKIPMVLLATVSYKIGDYNPPPMSIYLPPYVHMPTPNPYSPPTKQSYKTSCIFPRQLYNKSLPLSSAMPILSHPIPACYLSSVKVRNLFSKPFLWYQSGFTDLTIWRVCRNLIRLYYTQRIMNNSSTRIAKLFTTFSYNTILPSSRSIEIPISVQSIK